MPGRWCRTCCGHRRPARRDDDRRVLTAWRTLDQDAQSDAAWQGVYRRFDVISPWTVGRVASSADVAAFYATRVQGDLQALASTGIRNMLVLFPGFSWANLMRVRGGSTRGRFLWAQAQSALGPAASTSLRRHVRRIRRGHCAAAIAASAADVPAGMTSGDTRSGPLHPAEGVVPLARRPDRRQPRPGRDARCDASAGDMSTGVASRCHASTGRERCLGDNLPARDGGTRPAEPHECG